MARVVGVKNKLLHQVSGGVKQYVLEGKQEERYLYKYGYELAAARDFFIWSEMDVMEGFSKIAKDSQSYMVDGKFPGIQLVCVFFWTPGELPTIQVPYSKQTVVSSVGSVTYNVC